MDNKEEQVSSGNDVTKELHELMDEVTLCNRKISWLEGILGTIRDRLDASDFLRDNPRGYRLEVVKPLLYDPMLKAEIAQKDKIVSVRCALGIGKYDFSNWEVYVIEDIPINESKSAIHVAVQYKDVFHRNKIFHNFFILDRTKFMNNDNILSRVNISTSSEAELNNTI